MDARDGIVGASLQNQLVATKGKSEGQTGGLDFQNAPLRVLTSASPSLLVSAAIPVFSCILATLDVP